MSASLQIRPELIEQMVAQARAAAPLETCGLLGGPPGRAVAIYPLSNILRSPVEYQADGQELAAAWMDIEARGWDIVGIYHSHPAGPDAPSPTDLARAYYPDSVYIIISLARQPPVVRGFRLAENRASQVALVVDGGLYVDRV